MGCTTNYEERIGEYEGNIKTILPGNMCVAYSLSVVSAVNCGSYTTCCSSIRADPSVDRNEPIKYNAHRDHDQKQAIKTPIKNAENPEIRQHDVTRSTL